VGDAPTDERRIAVPGGEVRSWSVGDDRSTGVPILFLHGGPGGSCDGFMSLTGLAAKRRLVMFDQLGSRTSSWRGEAHELWNVGRFCDEVDAVRTAWDLESVILLGHSWGGWLSIEYLCRGAAGVEGAVLCDTTASFASFRASIARRVAELSPSARAAIAAADVTGDLDTDSYRSAAIEFYRSFVVRNVPGDDIAATVFDRQRATEVFRHMQGADELHGDGSLADWDRQADLAGIDAPTLVIGGRYDHMDPACAEEIATGLADSELHVFADSSHCPHLEQPDDVVDVVAGWLDRRA
jgi:L-proline amide hydrolase